MSINDFDFSDIFAYTVGYGVAVLVVLGIAFGLTIGAGFLPEAGVPTVIAFLAAMVGGWLILLVLTGTLEWTWDKSCDNQEAVWRWATHLSIGFFLASIFIIGGIIYTKQWNSPIATPLLVVPIILCIVFGFIQKLFKPEKGAE